MKHFIFSSVLIVLSCALVSCSSNVEDSTTSLSNQELKSSLSEGQFKKTVDNTIASISKFTTQTRSSAVSPSEIEKNVSQELEILAADGAFIQRQLLDDPSLTDDEREKISSLDNNQLAVLSFVANTIKEPYNTDNGYVVSNEVACLVQALTGVGLTTGELTASIILKVGAKTLIKRAALAAFGVAGGALAIAIMIKDYYDCMKQKQNSNTTCTYETTNNLPDELPDIDHMDLDNSDTIDYIFERPNKPALNIGF